MQADRWTPEQTDQLIALRLAGEPFAECSRRIGKSAFSCQWKAWKLGVCGLKGRQRKPESDRQPVAHLSGEVDLEYDADELEFMRAVEAFKRQWQLRYPAMTDYLRIAKSLGYRKP